MPTSDLSTLVGTMDTYPGDLAVQELGCSAIVALCASAENRTNLVRLQAAERVFIALQRHDGDARLQVGLGVGQAHGVVVAVAVAVAVVVVCVCACACVCV